MSLLLVHVLSCLHCWINADQTGMFTPKIPTKKKKHISGLAVKKMIDCGAGVVDADYRGNVGVVLFNFGPEDFHVEIGDRIAQLILEQISMVPAVKVEELTETERGAGGFGSTGVSVEPEKKVAKTED